MNVGSRRRLLSGAGAFLTLAGLPAAAASFGSKIPAA
jgi:hypothetical protein